MYPSCPRCESSNTKFCYYNNYSLSQPRYYCRNCQRYWTIGGSLCDIPPGEGSRRRRQRRRQRSCSCSTKRLGKKENNHYHDRDNSCPEIDLAAVFANFLNGQSPNSSTSDDTITRSEQGTEKIEDEEGLGQFLEEDMFEFQDFLNDKEIQEIMISFSFSDH